MQASKQKKKERIKLNMRVQLKNDVAADGTVTSKNPGKGQWKVTWAEGSLKGKTTDQSSKSLRPWQLDLSSAVVGSSEEEDEEDDEPAEAPSTIDHAMNQKRFEAHAKTLVGKKVVVSFYLMF
jgi:hypothetical protein